MDELRMNKVQEQHISSEMVAAHSLLRWLTGIAVVNFGILVLGGVSIWVNDGNQDKQLARHAEQFIKLSENIQTKYEAELQLRLVESKIENAKSYNKGIKSAITRIELEMKKIKADEDNR